MVTSANDNGTGPYLVTSANDNGTRIVIPVAGKRVKAFKKRHEGKPDLEGMDGDDGRSGANDEPEDEE